MGLVHGSSAHDPCRPSSGGRFDFGALALEDENLEQPVLVAATVSAFPFPARASASRRAEGE